MGPGCTYWWWKNIYEWNSCDELDFKSYRKVFFIGYDENYIEKDSVSGWQAFYNTKTNSRTISEILREYYQNVCI